MAGQTLAVNSFYRNKSILIPGGAGFIGSRLARRLCDLKARVVVVDSFETHGGANPFNLNGYGDRIALFRERIEAYLVGHDLKDFDFIFNCTGLTDHHIGFNNPGLDYEMNCSSGLCLLQALAAAKGKSKIIGIGSRNQYGTGQSHFREQDRLRPLDIQSVHKTTLEHYHRCYGHSCGLDYAFLRLTNTYGPGQRMNGGSIGFFGEILKSSLQGREIQIYGSLDRVKDLLFVDDAVEAMLRVGMLGLDHEDPVYNVGGQPCRIKEVLQVLKRQQEKIEVKVLPFPAQIEKINVGDAGLATAKIRQDTGWVPGTSLQEGIAETLAYYRQNAKHYWSD
ncbi:MAG: NAD-dependent epimerase/dehydratase family protein [Desulfohalobiaceae bacterium]|nr:NAD-dependent epimerase/dehydratase family protein [Desulfohalobiaceae bacterium]